MHWGQTDAEKPTEWKNELLRECEGFLEEDTNDKLASSYVILQI